MYKVRDEKWVDLEHPEAAGAPAEDIPPVAAVADIVWVEAVRREVDQEAVDFHPVRLIMYIVRIDRMEEDSMVVPFGRIMAADMAEDV